MMIKQKIHDLSKAKETNLESMFFSEKELKSLKTEVGVNSYRPLNINFSKLI